MGKGSTIKCDSKIIPCKLSKKHRQYVFVCFFLITFATSINVKDMFGLGTQEILVIALIILLLFGGKKIPELMKGLGKGVKSFKEGMNSLEDEDENEKKKDN